MLTLIFLPAVAIAAAILFVPGGQPPSDPFSAARAERRAKRRRLLAETTD